ncbi:MAG: hypothetical protein JSU72_20630, partial [Deltaproteobacteria bacterium]
MKLKGRKIEKTARRVKVIQSWLQHHFNSVHVYCRLVRVMPKGLAKTVVLSWERTAIYRLMY